MSAGHRIFVYGTLMRGEHHHDQLEGAQYLGPGQTLAEFDLVRIDYFPALLREGQTAVHGELYLVDDEILARLDALEEVPHYYLRESIALSDGSRADTYIMPREHAAGAEPIVSGSFRSRV